MFDQQDTEDGETASVAAATLCEPENAGFVPPRRKLLSDVFFSLSARGGYTVASFIVTVLVARLLPPHDVGVYFMMLSAVLVALPLANLSLPEPTLSAIAAANAVGDRQRAYAVCKGTLRLGCLSAIMVATLFLCVPQSLSTASRFHGLSRLAEALLALWIAVIAIQSLLVAIFQGLENIRLKVLFDGFLGKLFCVGALGLFWGIGRHSTLNEVLFVIVASEFVSILVSGVLLDRELRTRRESVSPVSAGEQWSNSWPFLILQLTAALTSHGDVLILGLFRSTREVALYGAALRLALFLGLPATAINVPIAPSIARLRAQGRIGELQNLLQMAATGTLITALTITIMYMAGGSLLLSKIFGGFYGQGALLLVIFSLGECVSIYIGPSMLGLAMSNEQRVLTVIVVSMSVVKCVAMLFAAKLFGAIGVALASVVANGFTKMVARNVMRHRVGVSTHARFRLISVAYKKACEVVAVRVARA